MKEVIEREHFTIFLRKDGITELVLKDNVIIDLDDSKEQEKLLKERMPDEGHLYLVVSGPGTNVTKESREYANQNPLKGKAMAILAKSLPQKIVANFMITVYRKLRPDYPVRLFLRREKAEQWLMRYLSANS